MNMTSPVSAVIEIGGVNIDDVRAAAVFDAYVDAHPDGTAFHLTRWGRAIARAMRHRPHYLAARRGDRLVGVLPLIFVRSPLFGNALISNAFAVQGGPLADDADVRAALDDAGWALAQRLGVTALEYRCPMADTAGPGWVAKENVYAGFKRPLGASSDDNLKAIPRKQRAEVRRSLEFDLDVRIARDDSARAAHFSVYATSVRNLGTPVFSPRLFAELLDAYGENADILTVSHAGRPIASVLSLYYKGVVLPYYGGGTEDARRWRGNDHMYWMLMEHARARGCVSFDFGRSKFGTGAFAFKKNWGFTPEPLTYGYRLGEGRAMPDINPNNPKYRLMTQMWQRMPLWLANRAGPLIARGLG